MGDWNTTQPTPQGVEPGTKSAVESGTPDEFGTDKRMLADIPLDGVLGEAIAPNRKTMH